MRGLKFRLCVYQCIQKATHKQNYLLSSCFFHPKNACYIARTFLEDILYGNNKQLRDEKGNAAHQESIETTNMQTREEIGITNRHYPNSLICIPNTPHLWNVPFCSIVDYVSNNKGENTVSIWDSISLISDIMV